jgi:YHS domain-containing protein
VLPQFDPATRTLKVRLEAANPGFILRPDMFVDVEYPISLPAALTVPTEAILDTGLYRTVFVDVGDGYFEPRHIETGWRMGDRVEITKGLMEGERIVVSGNFLIDSESRLRTAAMGLRDNAVEDPVCGMQVDPVKAGGQKSEYKGKTYYFCSELCKSRFDKNPEQYAKGAR